MQRMPHWPPPQPIKQVRLLAGPELMLTMLAVTENFGRFFQFVTQFFIM